MSRALGPPGILLRCQTTTVVWQATACRPFSTSSTQCDKSKRERGLREIKTLDPSKMSQMGQQVFDISGFITACFQILSSSSQKKKSAVQVRFKHRKHGIQQTFPSGSIGSLYYYRPAPPMPDIAGGLRFRSMPHIDAFLDGKDLLHPDGSPWQVPLCKLARSSFWEPVRSKLLEESLVDSTVLADLIGLKMSIKGGHRYLYSLDQPFELDMSAGTFCKTLISRSIACQFVWDVTDISFITVGERQRNDPSPYTGRIRVRFELKTLPDSTPALVVRVLDVLTPVECHQPNLDWIKRPTPGELLSRIRKRTNVPLANLSDDDFRPISYDLQNRKCGKDIAKFAGITMPRSLGLPGILLHCQTTTVVWQATACRPMSRALGLPGILLRCQTTTVVWQATACRLFSVNTALCCQVECSGCSNIVLEFSQTSSAQYDKSEKERGLREIKTLDPSKMIQMGQEVFDISGFLTACFLILSSSSQKKKFMLFGPYKHNEGRIRQAFPSGSIGSLYYYRPAPLMPDIAGGLRFRLMPHVEAFADGKDLLNPDGSPWHVHLCKLARTKSWGPVRSKLLEESLVDPTVLADLTRLEMDPKGRHIYLYSLDQPFELDMSTGTFCKTLISRSMACQFKWHVTEMFQVTVGGKQRNVPSPYTGRIRVRLELKTLPDSTPALVVRVLDVLTPVECHQPNLDWIKRPIPGELLSCAKNRNYYQPANLSDDDYRLIFYNLRKRKYGKDIAKFAGITLP
ncbi:hypothetical protein CVT26_009042 [Gymnopilus dilepis]|uniref:Uncharacterized protein n=1 Tax=Gymnopilus dilepis TaxID=231916 RepID=A0A409YB16_9AGAR|nr:hypothetical protein CVT26_009042 [Gymnopilus dilepis]